VKEAKQEANEQGVADWRPLTEETPEPLPDKVRKAASHLYRAGTNLYTGQDWFEVPPLDEVLKTIRRLRDERF
jgi:phosphoribosylaminoimidazole-succinocarboxamide synthase